MRNRIVRGVLMAIGVLLLVAIIGIVIYLQPLRATDAARAALVSTANLRVTNTADLITFMPSSAPKAGFVFYPGAKVDPVAYSESLRRVAAGGYAVFVVKFPLNFAIIAPKRVNDVMAAHPSIKRWALGGHSLGGASACLYVRDSSQIHVLIFWAAYCDKSFDLSSRTDVQITSISGSRDGLATPQRIAATRVYAPANAKYVVIEGGNHAQFGDYGKQSGDQQALISPEQQRQQVVKATLAALEALKP